MLTFTAEPTERPTKYFRSSSHIFSILRRLKVQPGPIKKVANAEIEIDLDRATIFGAENIQTPRYNNPESMLKTTDPINANFARTEAFGFSACESTIS